MNEIRQYAAPTCLEETLDVIAGGEVTMFAGGTDVLPQTCTGGREFNPLLVNISRLPELKGIDRQNGFVRIGSLATVTDILKDAGLESHARVLVNTADCFASGQVRNTATLGGNICNASPAGDMIIPLLLLDAEVELACRSGAKAVTRILPLRDFFTGPGQTVLAENEILVAIRFPTSPNGFRAVFQKFGTRPAMDISVVSIGFGCRVEEGILRDVRIAFGAVAPVPLRGIRTEAVLEGSSFTDETVMEAVAAAVEEISPITDVRATAWYRTELIKTMFTRILQDVANP